MKGTRLNHRSMIVVCMGFIAMACFVNPGRAGAAGEHGRYLRDATELAKVDLWGEAGGAGSPVEYDAAVVDGEKGIAAGTIRFTYDTFVGAGVGPGAGAGGAALSGGFILNPGVKVKPGYHLQWVQTVRSTFSGGDAVRLWNVPGAGAGEYPDAGPANKKYAFQSPVRVNPPAPVPALGFHDFAARPFAGGPQTWQGELGLVCVADVPGPDGAREARVINTFEWGFVLAALPVPPAAPGIGVVLAQAPGAWGPPRAAYLAALNSFYADECGGGGGKGKTSCSAPPEACGLTCIYNTDCNVPAHVNNGVCVPLAGPVRSTKYSFTANSNCFDPLPRCGDRSCQPEDGENSTTCPDDCPGESPVCGDDFCQSGESPCDCPIDCLGECGGCGDGVCDELGGENGCNCPQDCGDCAYCSDGYCDPEEDATTCPMDCALQSSAGACCQGLEVCEVRMADACMLLGGIYMGDGTSCADVECVPTVSEWGLIVMTMLGLTVGTILYRRRRRPRLA